VVIRRRIGQGKQSLQCAIAILTCCRGLEADFGQLTVARAAWLVARELQAGLLADDADPPNGQDASKTTQESP
jgi:hypothetical protein